MGRRPRLRVVTRRHRLDKFNLLLLALPTLLVVVYGGSLLQGLMGARLPVSGVAIIDLEALIAGKGENLAFPKVPEKTALEIGRFDAVVATAWKPAFDFVPALGLFLMVLLARFGRLKLSRAAFLLTWFCVMILRTMPAIAASLNLSVPSYAVYDARDHFFLALTDTKEVMVNGSVSPFNVYSSNRFLGGAIDKKVDVVSITPSIGLTPDALIEHGSLALMAPYYLLCCNITKYVQEIRNWHPRPLILENRNSPTRTQGRKETSKNRGATNATNMKPDTRI